jgi:hypothetical protein
MSRRRLQWICLERTGGESRGSQPTSEESRHHRTDYYAAGSSIFLLAPFVGLVTKGLWRIG